jgi:hypothetical protein
MDENAVNWPDVPELYALLDRFEERWKLAYPGLNITAEVLRMAEWCDANGKRGHKRNWQRFAVNWLARAHTRLLEQEVRTLVLREQQRIDSAVGKFRG